MGAVLMGMNAWISYRRDFGRENTVSFRELPSVTLRATPALLMPAILLVGIYSGVTTSTEAAAIAALYALVISAALYHSLKVKTLYAVFVESARSAASVGLVIGASMILTYVVVQENIPQFISGCSRVWKSAHYSFLFWSIYLSLFLAVFWMLRLLSLSLCHFYSNLRGARH